MFKNNNFQIFLLFAIEMAVLSTFWRNKGLGPLGVNKSNRWLACSSIVSQNFRMNISIDCKFNVLKLQNVSFSSASRRQSFVFQHFLKEQNVCPITCAF